MNGDLGLTGGGTVRDVHRSALIRSRGLCVNPVNGNLYVVVTTDPDSELDKSDIYITQSTNGGTSWSTRARRER